MQREKNKTRDGWKIVYFIQSNALCVAQRVVACFMAHDCNTEPLPWGERFLHTVLIPERFPMFLNNCAFPMGHDGHVVCSFKVQQAHLTVLTPNDEIKTKSKRQPKMRIHHIRLSIKTRKISGIIKWGCSTSRLLHRLQKSNYKNIKVTKTIKNLT